jgi:hypothetical protein
MAKLEGAPATRNKALAALKGVARACWEMTLLNSEDYQRIKSIKQDAGSRELSGRYVPTDEIGKLVQTCARDASPAGVRDAALFSIAAAVGLRRAELAALRIELVHPHFIFHRIETYWEFHCDSAIIRVSQIEKLLGAGSLRSRHSRYFARDMEPVTEQNCRCLRFYPKNGDMVRIYAKTPSRIRFEVEHYFQDRDNRQQTFTDRTTTNSVEGILDKIVEIRAMAATEINILLERLDDLGKIAPYSDPVIDFLYKFSDAVQDQDNGLTILDLLATNKQVVKGNHSPLADELTRLKNTGILTQKRRIFIAALPYRKAIDLLSSEKLETLEFHRRRREIVFVRRVRSTAASSP